MRIMFTITALGDESAQAAAIKEKLQAAISEFGLEGEIKGEALDYRANFTGMYSKVPVVPVAPVTPPTVQKQ